jgi:hypothetical protein
MNEETVLIPHPYQGLTVRLGDREANVHEVKDGTVYYGMYRDDPGFYPACVGLYRKSAEEFINSLGRAILDGAMVYSLLNDERPFPKSFNSIGKEKR